MPYAGSAKQNVIAIFQNVDSVSKRRLTASTCQGQRNAVFERDMWQNWNLGLVSDQLPRPACFLPGLLASLEGQVDDLKQAVMNPQASGNLTTNTFDPILQSTPEVFGAQFAASTPARSIDPPTTRTSHLSSSSAVVADLMSLPRAFFHSLADYWFNENQHWLPILERTYIQSSLDALPEPIDHIPDVVLRALIALRIAYSSQAICLGYEGRRRLSLHLRSQVVMEAMGSPSLKSAQALHIIALLDYGSDEIPSTFGIMAMTRRMGENIGIFRQLLSQIETQSPMQVLPAAGESLAGGGASIALTWAIVSFDTVSGLGLSWRDASSALFEHLSSIAYLDTPCFRDSFRIHVHLAAIGLQPAHEFITAYAKGDHQKLEGQTMTLADELYRSMTSYVQGLPASGYTTLADGDIDFDINHVFTRLLANATIITIYERYALAENGDFELARDRCNHSCDELVDIVRNLSDADIEVNTPTFGHFLSVAARFKIVMMKTLNMPHEPQLDILVHGINMCARRWPLARRLDYTLTIAILEVMTAISSSIPEEFWDLKKSSLDISENMKKWLHERLPSIQTRNLALPYT